MNSGRHARWVIGAQYFLYFGVMGIYLPFFNLYCYQLGFSGWQIGALSAARSIVLILFAILWGMLADRFRSRRRIYIACNFISAGLWGFFLLTTEFMWMLVITIAYGIFYAPLIAFLEAFTMGVLGKKKKRYGRMRLWGSLAFILIVLILGRIVEIFSIKIIISLIFAGSWVQALVSLAFPRLETQHRRPFGTGLRRLMDLRVTVFLFCAFAMLLSHGAYYAFFSIHLSNMGYDGFFIGLCWAVAVAAEIVAMFFSEKIFKRFAYESVLTISFAVAVVRWAGLWLAESAAGILLLQTMHAVTYAAFHMASILYIDSCAPDEAKTTGQAVNNAVTYGLGLMVGFFLSGALYEPIGSAALFALSACIALLGGGLFQAFVWRRPKASGNGTLEAAQR